MDSNEERVRAAQDALNSITIGVPGMNEDVVPSIVVAVKTLRFTARHREWRDDDGAWRADISIFHKRGFIHFDVLPNANYWTKEHIKRVAKEAYKNYKNYKREGI